MVINLDEREVDVVLQSLAYTLSAFNRTVYPSHEFKQERLESVQVVIDKIRLERKKERN